MQQCVWLLTRKQEMQVTIASRVARVATKGNCHDAHGQHETSTERDEQKMLQENICETTCLA